MGLTTFYIKKRSVFIHGWLNGLKNKSQVDDSSKCQEKHKAEILLESEIGRLPVQRSEMTVCHGQAGAFSPKKQY